MELDDLKNTWNELNGPAQQQLNPKTIDHMTKKNYRSNLNKIAYPEIAGTIICIIAAVFIAYNFSRLNSLFLQGAGIISILLLVILPVISLASIRQLNITGDVNKPYAETLKAFAVQKIRFHNYQKINVLLSYLLLVTTIVLLSKFYSGKDITGSRYFWIFSFSFGYIFLLFYSKWVSKYYTKTLLEAEELLKELAS